VSLFASARKKMYFKITRKNNIMNQKAKNEEEKSQHQNKGVFQRLINKTKYIKKNQ